MLVSRKGKSKIMIILITDVLIVLYTRNIFLLIQTKTYNSPSNFVIELALMESTMSM